MKLKRPKVKREYTIDDLAAIAEQLGGRLRFEIIPVEMMRGPAPLPDLKSSKKAKS